MLNNVFTRLEHSQNIWCVNCQTTVPPLLTKLAGWSWKSVVILLSVLICECGSICIWCASITCRKNRCRKEMVTFFSVSKFLASLFLWLWKWQDYYLVREWHFHPWVVGCFHSLRVAGTGMSFLGQLKANSVSHLDVTAFHSMLVHFMSTIFYFIDRFHKTCQSPPKWRRPRSLSIFPCLQMRRYLPVVFQLFLDFLVNYLLGTKNWR